MGDRKVVYGIRNNELVLQDVVVEYVMDVPEKYGIPGRWRGTDMLGFIHSVLKQLLDTVPEGGSCTLKYNGDEFGRKYRIETDNDADVFLDNEFIQYIKKCKS